MMVNERKSFVEMTVEADRHTQGSKIIADSNNYYKEKKHCSRD